MHETPEEEGGANTISLRDAQQNFLRYGGKTAVAAKYSRTPTAEDIRDPDWKPFDPAK